MIATRLWQTAAALTPWPATRTFSVTRSDTSSPLPESNDPVLLSWDAVPQAEGAEAKTTGVAVITFNRPKHLNAMTEELGNQFCKVVEELKSYDNLRAVVLTGAGRAFSAGGDLAFLQSRATSLPQQNSEIMRRFYARFLSVRGLAVPTIAAVNGSAVGAGFCLALACDMRIGARGSRVGLNFVRIGLHTGMAGTWTLPALVGPQVAARMLLTGELVSTEQAESWGLFLETHPQDQVLPAALSLARQIATASPAAVRSVVRTLRLRSDEGLERALQREADAQAGSYATVDYKEGLAALKERRDPMFSDFKEGA